MKRLIIPALSLVLMAGLPAQASPAGNIQVAQNEHSQKDQKDQKPGVGHQDRGHQDQTGGQGQSATHGGSQGGGPGQGSGHQVQTRTLRQGGTHGSPAITTNTVITHAQPITTTTSPVTTMSGQRGSAHINGATTRTGPANLDANRMRMNQDSNRGQGNQNFNRSNTRPNTAMQSGRHTNANRDNVRNFHRNFNAPRRFHADAYLQPQGYQYRHWGYGERLPQIYFMRNYWIMDFLMYGLDEPPPGYVWVRYGPDALLIDQYDGEIVEVVYGVYY